MNTNYLISVFTATAATSNEMAKALQHCFDGGTEGQFSCMKVPGGVLTIFQRTTAGSDEHYLYKIMSENDVTAALAAEEQLKAELDDSKPGDTLVDALLEQWRCSVIDFDGVLDVVDENHLNRFHGNNRDALLSEYSVVVKEFPESVCETLFVCSAEDDAHALEQAQSAYPEMELVEIVHTEDAPLQYVIQCPSMLALDPAQAYWSTDLGWVDRGQAEMFTFQEKLTLGLPLSANNDARWVSLQTIESGTKAPLVPGSDLNEAEVSMLQDLQRRGFACMVVGPSLLAGKKPADVESAMNIAAANVIRA